MKLPIVVKIFIATFTIISSSSFTVNPLSFSRSSSVKLPDSNFGPGRPYEKQAPAALPEAVDFSRPSSMKFPDEVDLFISARFLKNFSEKRARELHKQLKELGLRAFIVDASAGDDFGALTMHCLSEMKAMVIIGCGEYGALTDNSYSSYWELKDANEKSKHMIVVQMCMDWPPKPTKDKEGRGTQQNSFILGRHGLCKLRWHRREWNAAECAIQIADAFHARYSRSSQGIEVKSDQPSPLEREHMTKRAIQKIGREQIDVCIISLHSPSMLHRLAQSSTYIYDIEEKLKPLAEESNVSILLVDGNDQDKINDLKKNLKQIASLILVGEGLLIDGGALTAESFSQSSSDILDLFRTLKAGDECQPQVTIALKYGAKAIKTDLEHDGFENVDLWDLSNNERSSDVLVDVWEDGNIFGHLKRHLSSIEKNEKKRYPGVETLAWTPPTQDWSKKIYGNLSLKVGDIEEIDKIKKIFIEAIKSKQTICFEIQPHSFHAIDDDPYHRARSIIYFMCQESSRVIKDTSYYSMGWYYLSKNEHLSELANEVEDNQSGYIVIWIDGIESSDIKQHLEKITNGNLKVIYIVTKNAETKYHDIVGPIKEVHKLRENDTRTIVIAEPRTDIELSQREVSVDVTLVDMPKYHGEELLDELFDTTSSTTGGNAVEQHEATFYRGDDGSIHLHVGVRNIYQLKHIFALMFFPERRKALEIKLGNNNGAGLRTKLDFKMRNPLKVFKQSVLELDTLTADQERVRRKAKEQHRVVIDGRAGSGKTYLAVHFMLERLTTIDRMNDKGKDGLMLFCFDAESLGNEIAKWLCKRLSGSINEKNERLKRIHFLHHTGEKPGVLYQMQVDESTKNEPELRLDYSLDVAMEYEYDLIVVDEGHHIFKKSKSATWNKVLQRFRRIPMLEISSSFLYIYPFSKYIIRKYQHTTIPKNIGALTPQQRGDIVASLAIFSSTVYVLRASFILANSPRQRPLRPRFDGTFTPRTERIKTLLSKHLPNIVNKRRKKIERILKKNKSAQAMILCDCSQAISTKIEWPKEFNVEEKYLTFTEVIRSLPMLTEASLLFQRFNQDATTNISDKVKGKGLRPGARMFRSEGVEEDYVTYVTEIDAELKKIRSLFPDENLHDTVALIVPNADSRKCLLKAGLESKLDEMGFRVVTAKEASERFSNDPPSDGKGHIIVDTVSSMNGLERLFVIVVDMDKPLEEKIEESVEDDYLLVEESNRKKEETNQKNLSEIYCACTRGMIYVSFVNKYIENGWMSFFQFTETMKTSYSSASQAIGNIQQESSTDLVSTNGNSSPLNQESLSAASAIGVANAVCGGQIENASNSIFNEVNAIARTEIFDVSKSNWYSEEKMFIPAFHPLQTSSGLSKFEPYVYEVGIAPKVPFILISPNVREIPTGAFLNNGVIEELLIPDTVTSIEARGLKGCSKLKKVTLSAKMTRIESSTFRDCSSLTTVEGMHTIQSIAAFAFQSCSSLKGIDVNQGTGIHEYAFEGCNAAFTINRI